MNNVLDTKNVLEISGIFEIPPYQRGYRWGEEATKLLTVGDAVKYIEAHSKKKDTKKAA